MLLTLYVIFSNQGESAVWGTLAVCERRPARRQSGKQPRTSPRKPPGRPPGRSPRSWPRGRADWSPGWWQGFPPSPGLSECFVVPFYPFAHNTMMITNHNATILFSGGSPGPSPGDPGCAAPLHIRPTQNLPRWDFVCFTGFLSWSDIRSDETYYIRSVKILTLLWIVCFVNKISSSSTLGQSDQ